AGTSFLLYLQRFTWGFVKVELKNEFGWDKTTLGWLDSAFMFSYSGGQIPGGMLGDWFGPRIVLSSMIVLWSVALLVTAVVQGLYPMFASRVLFGLAQAGCYPNLNKITKIWFPPTERTYVQGWVASFFGRMGGAASFILFGTFMLGTWHLPWRSAVGALTGLGVLFGIAFFCFFRNTPRTHPWANAAEAELISAGDASATVATGSLLNWKSVLRQPVVQALLFQQFTCAFVDNFFSNWLPLYLDEVKGIQMASGGWMSALPLIGGAWGGMLAGGVLQGWLIHRTGNRRWSRSGIGLVGNLLAGVCLFSSLAFDNATHIVGVFFCLKFFADWAQPACWGATTDLGGRNAASLFALVNTAGSIAGFVSGPVMGSTIEFFGKRLGSGAEHDPAGWTALFIMIGVVYLASAASWLAIDCTKPILAEDLCQRDGE
ncbi:MAG: MFS transporter, partial [Planctomycetes bacterium]|nr:MFS transporter [Planctomycetota bacterium]